MGMRALLLTFLLGGCAGHDRLERLHSLSDPSRELYAKYRQFMSEDQQDTFLAFTTDDERERFVKDLKVEERLERYPPFIRDAIWAQDVVPGMDNQAVLLSWGVPSLREFDDQQLARGNAVERWNYRRNDTWTQVVVTNGVVTQVLRTGPK